MATNYANPEVLVTTDWVAEHLNDPKVKLVEVDVDTASYDKGHVRNAIGWNWQTDLNDRVVRDVVDPRTFAELCRRSGTECVWAYGPIYDAYCTQAADYVAKVEAGLVATGLPIVAGTPLCIPEAELGDTVDHVRPDLKDTYTRRYFELLQPYIDRSAAIVRTAQ